MVRDIKLEPSQFREFVDINGRTHLVFVRFSLKVTPDSYAYELLFAGKCRQGMRGRFVGKMDEPLPGGRAAFRHVESLHGYHLGKHAWWALNKTKFPIIGKVPGPNETLFVPYPVVVDENGHETQEPAPYEAGDFVTFVAEGTNIQAYVFARHDPVCTPGQRLYVILCVKLREYIVQTVYLKDIRPPEIQCVTRPGAGDCWWVRDYNTCMNMESLQLHLDCCPPPREGFVRGNIVSVPDPILEGNRLCACVERTWILDGRMVYQVQYPNNAGSLYAGYQNIFRTEDLLGPSVKWCVSDFRWVLFSSCFVIVLCVIVLSFSSFDLSPEADDGLLSPSPVLSVDEAEFAVPELDLGEPAMDVSSPPSAKVRRVSLVMESPLSPFKPIQPIEEQPIEPVADPVQESDIPFFDVNGFFL